MFGCWASEAVAGTNKGRQVRYLISDSEIGFTSLQWARSNCQKANKIVFGGLPLPYSQDVQGVGVIISFSAAVNEDFSRYPNSARTMCINEPQMRIKLDPSRVGGSRGTKLRL